MKLNLEEKRAKRINAMPIIQINKTEMKRMVLSDKVNPVYMYPELAKIIEGEIGYDNKGRYIVVKGLRRK